MRVLLDTQAWLWMLSSPERLNAEARSLVEDAATTLLLSSASSWEIAIKWCLGKLELPDPPDTFVPTRIRSSGVVPIAIEHSHALRVVELEPHHRDPFDRLLIAQALVEGVPILTSDPVFADYTVDRIEAGSGDR
jgi:PIN domain nuclease of toxin-antitoxin system